MSFNLKKAFGEVKINGAEWIGLRLYRETMKQRSVRDGKPEANITEFDEGVMFEVLVNGQFGYAGTCDLSASGIQRAAEAAYNMAEMASVFRIAQFSSQQRQQVKGRYETPIKKPLSQVGAGEINELLVDACSYLSGSEKIVSTSAQVIHWEVDTELVSSNGSDISQKLSQISYNLSAIAQDGSTTQKRSTGYFSNCRQMGGEFIQRQAVLEKADELCKEAVELLSADECPTGIYDTVLAPDQMFLQIHESIGHPLELDRIMGDERNYAGWSFVKLSDFGQLRYGSNLLNVTYDPTISSEMASYAYDESGSAATREYIIKDGILLRGLGSVDSQKRSGVPGVANFRATSWNRAPIDRMANLNLEPGDKSFSELIGSTERGVFMKSNNCWSIDDYRRKFQFGCEYGKLIENGKLTKTVRNPNYRGIGIDFWQKLVGVGNAATIEILGAANCGKGEPNQVIRVGHSSPVCKFANIEVFGGDK